MENFVRPRPVFPKKAVVTSGMPYGNKELHFAHVGLDLRSCVTALEKKMWCLYQAQIAMAHLPWNILEPSLLLAK